MKTKRTLSLVGVTLLVTACAVCMAACGSSKLTGGVAATVNGEEIAEDDVTTYIEDIRTSYGLTDDSTWGSYLSMYGMSAEDLREDIINMFVEEKAVKIAGDQRGITVSSDEIDASVASIKENFDSDEEWADALESAGFTEESYRDEVEESLLYEKVEESVMAELDTEMTDEKRLEYAQAYAEAFDGARKSSHILFAAEDETTAQSVLEQINAGTLDFAEAAEKYSTDTASAADGGNVGWDCLTSFVDEYQVALEELAKDQVSGLVTSEYGIHIIKCTDVFTLDGDLASIDDLPDEIKAYVEELIEEEAASDDFSEWLTTFVEGLDVVINDMPSNVPYNVEISSSTTTETTDDELEVSDVEDESAETEDDATEADEGDADAEADADADAEADAEASPSSSN